MMTREPRKESRSGLRAAGALGAIAALAVVVAAAVRAAPEGKQDGQGGEKGDPVKDVPAWKVAPDKVLYANRRSYEAMQEKALGPNLLPNGSFEQGRYWPAGWDPVDRLGTFWVKGGTRGERCVRLYTNVLDTQWNTWHEKVLAHVKRLEQRTDGKPQSLPRNPLPPPPAKKPTSPPYYDTVAGMHGIHYRSRLVKVKPRAIYRVSVDARVERGGDPKVFTKGFFHHRGLRRNAGRAPMTLTDCGEKWQRYARIFHPSDWKSTLNDRPITPELLQVQLYAYWPVGDYFFDNVRLEIVGYSEPEEERESSGSGRQGKSDEDRPTLDEDEFPVFDP